MRLEGYYFPEIVFILLVIYFVILVVIVHESESIHTAKYSVPITYTGLVSIIMIFAMVCNVDHKDFIKKQRNVIIDDKIVPVKDTLIVIGKDTMQIEKFYEFKEYKE